MKALKVIAVSGTLAALSFGGAWAQDVKKDVQDIREDRQDIRKDVRDLHQDRRELRHDLHPKRAEDRK